MTDLLPSDWYACVEHAVESVTKVLRHDDRSVDGEFEVDESRSDDRYDFLHPVNLLAQEDVQRLHHANLPQCFFHLRFE